MLKLPVSPVEGARRERNTGCPVTTFSFGSPRRGRFSVELQPNALPCFALMVHYTLRIHGASNAVSRDRLGRNGLPFGELVQGACSGSELVVTNFHQPLMLSYAAILL